MTLSARAAQAHVVRKKRNTLNNFLLHSKSLDVVIHAIFRCTGLSLRFQVVGVNTIIGQGIKQLRDFF